ncbi:hypothetical protein [Streptomyces monashensis]|uniref:hypothetical protein n=1 Tax=Streptomyces monashensis TaxID=1678012 RepID=UPI0011608E19|nr:hypothetical protein [Streptomyces monashensis]
MTDIIAVPSPIPASATPVGSTTVTVRLAGGDDCAGGEGGQGVGVSGAAQLLKFSAFRDPVLLARCVKLRVIEPENEYCRRGLQAAILVSRS